MSEDAFWAIIICAVLASCVADDWRKTYERVNEPKHEVVKSQ